jgi:hypothetical protein
MIDGAFVFPDVSVGMIEASATRDASMPRTRSSLSTTANWDGKMLWEVRHPDHHHHGIMLRNGNVLLNCMGEVPQEIARRVKGGMVEKDIMQSGQYAARRDADAGKMYSDYLAEVTRAGRRDGLAMADLGAFRPRGRRHRRNASAADVVGTGEQHGGIGERRYPGELSANKTVVRISRSTGKILWKLAPPTVAGQHAPTRLANGNILIFDNGVHRLDDSLPYSRVIEVDPATNRIVWKYQDKPAWNFFSPRMGNAQRLPNGNTLITEASFG